MLRERQKRESIGRGNCRVFEGEKGARKNNERRGVGGEEER